MSRGNLPGGAAPEERLEGRPYTCSRVLITSSGQRTVAEISPEPAPTPPEMEGIRADKYHHNQSRKPRRLRGVGSRITCRAAGDGVAGRLPELLPRAVAAAFRHRRQRRHGNRKLETVSLNPPCKRPLEEAESRCQTPDVWWSSQIGVVVTGGARRERGRLLAAGRMLHSVPAVGHGEGVAGWPGRGPRTRAWCGCAWVRAFGAEASLARIFLYFYHVHARALLRASNYL
jgi:hypothetical protein